MNDLPLTSEISGSPTIALLSTAAASQLSAVETDTIDLFVRIAQLFGVSKSVGEIYGLLFISPAPISVEDVRARLKMSSGSASQGLNLLRRVGAIRTTYLAGDRRDYYVAEVGLRKIATGFLRERITPHLLDQDERITHLATLVRQTQAIHRPLLEERIQILQSWRKQARELLPIVLLGLEYQEHQAQEAS